MHLTEESENKDAEWTSVMENFPKMNEEKFGLSVSVFLCVDTLDCNAEVNTECNCDFYK